MNKEQLYPTTIENLMFKLNYIIKNDQNQEKASRITEWLNWYEKQEYTLDYKFKDGEFLMAFYNNGKFSLQVWQHAENIDSIVFNLISNHYDEYNNEDTQLTEFVE